MAHENQENGTMSMPRSRVTIADVASEAKVSPTTVSFTLRDTPGAKISAQTRARVKRAARRLGYVPDAAAQALAGSATMTIGVVYPDTRPYLSSQLYLLQFLDGLTAVTREHKHRILLESIDEATGGDGYAAIARERRVDGLILLDTPNYTPADQETLHSLASGHPVVFLGRPLIEGVASVDVNNRRAAAAAVDHLIARGHRRIGCITNAAVTNTAARDRLAGYVDALSGAGIDRDDALVREGNFTPESGLDAMRSLLDGGREPTAVFVASDVVAAGALAAIAGRGLSIPGDIAVVGFDDDPLAAFLAPPLTTVGVPKAELGRRAGEMILERVSKPDTAPFRAELPTDLVVRASA